MSDRLPFDIQTEIIKKLPIKSLIQFRSVSKTWKSLIDSSKFIHDNSVRDNQPHHLLVRYKLDSVRNYVSIIDDDDDDNFPQHKFYPTVPVTLNRLWNAKTLGSSHGLLCFYGFYRDIDVDYETEMVVLWNPTIRKSVGIVVPNVSHGYMVIGFGVCPNTTDPKLVKITSMISLGTDNETCVSWKVEVFTLSSRGWRTLSIGMPSKLYKLLWGQVFINGVIYWLGYETRHYRIISFDLKSEEVGEVFLSDRHLSVAKLMESLAVIESYYVAEMPVCAVWKMNNGVLKSFTKLYIVKATDGAICNWVLEFRKNGEPIVMKATDETDNSEALEVYEPCSGHTKDLGVDGIGGLLTSCSVISYTETLFMLHQSDTIID